MADTKEIKKVGTESLVGPEVEVAPESKVPNAAHSADLYNHDTGAWENIPETEVNERILAGTHTFQTGVRIPVIAPDGSVGDIPAENAHEAFKDGFRWVTASAKDANEEIQQERIRHENFANQPGTAFVAGALRGATLGLSDVGLKAMGLDEADKEVAERNEGATLAGEISGIVASSLYGGSMGGAVAGTQAAGRTAGAAAATRLGVGATGSKILANVGQEVAEGALFGVGKTVSEAALGQTEDVLDSLASNVGWGALIGGATGGLFGSAQASVPFAKQLWEGATEKTGDFVTKLAKKQAEARLIPVLNKAGQEQLAKEVPELLDDELAMRLAHTDAKVLKETAANARREVAEVTRQQKELIKETKETLKEASEGAQAQIAKAVEKTAGDLEEGSKVLYQDLKTYREEFQFQVDGLRDSINHPAVHANSIIGRAENLVDQMSKLDNRGARTIATRLKALLETNPIESVGDELTFAYKALRDVTPHLTKLDDLDKQLVGHFLKDIDDLAKRHPNIQGAHAYRNLSEYTEAYDKFMGLYMNTIGKLGKEGVEKLDGQVMVNGRPVIRKNGKQVMRALVDPSTQEAFQVALTQFEEFLPLMRKYGEGFKDLNDLTQTGDELAAALKQFTGKNVDIDPDAVGELFARLGLKSEKDISRARELAEVLANTEENAVGKAQAIRQALGKEPDAALDLHAEVAEKVAKIQQIRNIEKANGGAGNGILKLAFRWVFPKRLKWLMPEALEDLITGPGSHVARFQAFREAVQKGQLATNAAINSTVSSLTGQKAQKIARATATETTKKKRTRVEETLKRIQELHEDMVPKLDGMPETTKGMMNRQKAILDYLKKVAPQDPLAGDSLSLNDSGWMPSDRDIARFDRVLKVADNPINALAAIQKGSITSEEVDALKNIYPGIYNRLQNDLLDDIINNQRKLSYQQKLVVGTLFELPTVYSLRPDFIARMQESYAQGEAGAPEGNQNNSKDLNLNPEQTVATEASRITYS